MSESRRGLSTDEIAQLLQDVADEVVAPRFCRLAEDQVFEKAPGDLVTVADREAEALITRTLRDAYPQAVVLGEEATADDPGLTARFAEAPHGFTVDPVDGTRNFVEGRPDYAVMVAETRGGVTVRSWIWHPESRTQFVAERGAGAWRNGVRLDSLEPRGADPLEGRVSRPHLVGRSAPGLAALRDTWWSCGVDYPHLATGDTDFLLYSGGGAAWDHAPGSLVVEEAGAFVGHLDGSPYAPVRSRPGIVAARSRDVFERVSPHAETLRTQRTTR